MNTKIVLPLAVLLCLLTAMDGSTGAYLDRGGHGTVTELLQPQGTGTGATPADAGDSIQACPLEAAGDIRTGTWKGTNGTEFTVLSQTEIKPFKVVFTMIGNCSGTITITKTSATTIFMRSFTINLDSSTSTGSLTGGFPVSGNGELATGTYTYKEGNCTTLTGSWTATPVTAPDPTPPTGTGSATPSQASPGTSVLLTVRVSPGRNPDSTGITVRGDLTQIGGSRQQAFFDDGTNGDVSAGNGTFSYRAVVSSTTSAGTKSLPIAISDAQNRSSSTSIALSVTQPPLVTSAAVYAQAALGGPYEMVLIITNDRNISRSIACELRYGNDQLWPDAWQFCVDSECWDYRPRAGFIFAANPETTTKFVFRSLGGTRSGYVVLSPEDGSQLSDFMVNYFYAYKSAGRIVDSTGVSASKVSKKFKFPVERSSGCDTGFAWAPAGNSPGTFSVELTLADDYGSTIATRSEQFHAHKAMFIGQIFSSMPADFLGHVHMEAPYEFALTVLRMDNGTEGPQFTVVEPTPY